MGASSQPESHENPITAYEKREDFHFFSEPYQKPWGMRFFFSLQLQRSPPQQKKQKIGGAFTIVHATFFNIAMENGPSIDDFPLDPPIHKGFSMAMWNDQMIQRVY